jgi:Polyferredoxin
MKIRQRIRKAILLASFIAYPLTFFALSPDLLLFGASERVVAGDVLFFAGLFLVALAFGRVFCGWICPAGALQELCFTISDRRPSRRLDTVKWILFVPWLASFIVIAVAAGGFESVDFLYSRAFGIPIAGAIEWSMYFGTVAIVLALALFAGKRGLCHALCWVSPFMIAATRLRERLRLPGLALRASPSSCTGCGACARACPMSLDLAGLVQAGAIRESECILCGSCVDACPSSAIRFGFSRAAQPGRAQANSSYEKDRPA